ncbi:phosphatidate phosphatase APP1 [Rhypophila decipiens]|uniref:Phosphatidate phosphatase APP1 n=1 Tax=Rhypophila decipiens TaxID=261697 RepID=A0AAN7B411_9PEZI|nr:phosphatidate phosphatase APP1 [Rhypophila decipiens]
MAPRSRLPRRMTGLYSSTSSSDSASLQSQTRSERGFPEAEQSLYNTFTSKSAQAAGLLSYLGSRNPLPVQITARDSVWLMDNVAFRGKSGQWEAEFVAAAFEGEPSAKIVDYVGDVARLLGLAKGSKEEAVVEHRIKPFVTEILPGRQVKVDFNRGSKLVKLSPGGRHGISSDIRQLPAAVDGDVVSSIADVPAGTTGILEMRTKYAEPEGWAVLSDVDDTIKITQTSDPTGILRSTFVSEPTPTNGLPAFYTKLQALVTPNAPWFYLSASPYNLYPFLREFISQHYPPGQLILRDSSWMTIPGLLSNLTLGTHEYKVDRIKKVHSWLPNRKMILIGDSTQSDPEAYGDICRRFPGWVKLVLIRRVTDIAAVGSSKKNEPERFEKAFEGIKAPWHVFEDPAECEQLVQETVRG